MYKAPTIELRVSLAAQEIHSVIMAHQQEISDQVKFGIDAAIQNVANTVKVQAREAAEKCIKDSVDAYFKYGRGREFIDTVIAEALNGVLVDFGKGGKT